MNFVENMAIALTPDEIKLLESLTPAEEMVGAAFYAVAGHLIDTQIEYTPEQSGWFRVAHISAVTIASELGNISSRFQSARKLMGYCGVFPSEDSSGKRIRRGGITKGGNAHLRRIVVESARVLSTSAARGRKAAQTTPGGSGRDHRNSLEGTASTCTKRYRTMMNAGKDQEEGHDGGRT